MNEPKEQHSVDSIMSIPRKSLTPSRRAPRRRREGFSLIEVTAAIGILSFCVIAIMGLVAVALRTSRQSIDKNIEARILQNIRSELLQEPFSALPDEGTVVFDGEAYRLEQTEPDESRKFYEATWSKLPNAILPSAQTSATVVTCKVTILNLVRKETSHHAILLSDNGF